MAKLSEMILGETARNLELSDRPATLLRRGQEERNRDALVQSELATAEQTRTLRPREDARAEKQVDLDARRVAVGEAGAELAKTGQALTERQVKVEEDREARAQTESDAKVSELEQATEALKRKNQAEAQQVAQNFVAPVVQQMIEFNKQYIESGDPKMKEQRDKLLSQFATNNSLKAYVGITPQFSELAGLSDLHLYDPNMTDAQIEKEKLDLISGLAASDQVYKKLQQDQANLAAAHVLLAERNKAQGKASGEVIGTAEGYTEVKKSGLELPPEELSENQQAKVQQNFGNYFSNSVFPDLKDTTGIWNAFEKKFDKKGLFRTEVAQMPSAMYNREAGEFSQVFKLLVGSSITSEEEKDALIDMALTSGNFDETSPMYRMLKKVKGNSLSNFKQLKTVKPKTAIMGN